MNLVRAARALDFLPDDIDIEVRVVPVPRL